MSAMRILLATLFLFLHISISGEPRTQIVDETGRAGEPGDAATIIFVDAQAAPDGNGSARAPYQTIHRALQRAREIRAERGSRIIVHVAPGEYVESLPLYLNVSDFELRGSTHLIKDNDGLPQHCGTEAAAVPCVQPGTETVIRPVLPLATQHVMLVIAPTWDSPADRVTDVAIRGLIIDGIAPNPALSGTAVLVDRAQNFLVRDNVTRRVLVGVLTRLASGTIRGHFAYDSNDGLAIGAGSQVLPATVRVFANRLTNNRSVGAVALGVAGVRVRVNVPEVQPVQVTYDRLQHPERVPDTLAIRLEGNDISRNGSFGLRFQCFSSNSSFYDTVDAQPMTARIVAVVRDNRFTGNGEYAITVEGAFAVRSNPRLFTAQMDGLFSNNDVGSNGRAGVFAGFMLNGVVTRNPGLIATNKYLANSRFALLTDLAVDEFDYDNPVLDPFDRTTPLNNVLEINGTPVIGRHVTCPAGFPCVQ